MVTQNIFFYKRFCACKMFCKEIRNDNVINVLGDIFRRIDKI